MRIIGIDVGTSSIKAVEIESAFGRFEIEGIHERSLEPGLPIQSVLAPFVKGLSKTPDRIVVSLPAGQTTFRNLHLPTRDKKAIQSGVGFELEDELPFSTEDMVFDYSILGQNKQGSALHVAVTLKSHVVASLSAWEEAQVFPDILTSESWAYRTLLSRGLTPQSGEGPLLVANLGSTKTTFYLHWHSAPSAIREISWGGHNLTEAIRQKFNLSLEQAEAIKISQGFVTSSRSDTSNAPASSESPPPLPTAPEIDPTLLSQCLEEALAPFAFELRQIALSCKSNTQRAVNTIYLTGGCSLLRGLPEAVEEVMQTPTRLLTSLSPIQKEVGASFTLATGLALCLVGSDRALCINFRKGDFAREVKTQKIDTGALRKPLIALAIVFVCFLVSFFVQTTVYQSRLSSTDGQLEKSIRSFFGQVSNSALKTYMNNPSTLRTSLNKELDKQRELAKLFGANPKSPTNYVRALSLQIPKDVVVDLLHLQIGTPPAETFLTPDPSSVSMTFAVTNPQMAERLTKLIENKMADFQRGKMEETTLGSEGKKWKITFSGKPNEDSYGK